MARHLTANIEDNNNQQFDFTIQRNIRTVSASIENVSVTSGTGLLFATTAQWNAQPSLVAKQNVVYVYTDYVITSDGVAVPGFKVGDGTTYLVDLPFSAASTAASGSIAMATTEEWNAQATLISENNILYIYTDHATSSSGEDIPAYKIGDGTTYLIDLPFSDEPFIEHINNTSIHVTSAEKDFWNNKVTAFCIDGTETLVLSKTD